jgi:hypothetical protein
MIGIPSLSHIQQMFYIFAERAHCFVVENARSRQSQNSAEAHG